MAWTTQSRNVFFYALFVSQFSSFIYVVVVFLIEKIPHCVCFSGDRYCPLLQEEGGVDKIHLLMTTYPADSNLSKISADILDKLKKHVLSR